MNNTDVLNFIETPEFKDFLDNYTFGLPATIGLISNVLKILMQKNINIINVMKELKTYMEFKKNIIIPDFLHNMKGVEIYYVDEDYGPATKFIGSLKNVSIKNNDLIVVTDDDLIKDKNWLKKLIKYHKDNRITCFVEKNLGKGIIWGYMGYIFKKNLIDKFGCQTKFYSPKIQYQRYTRNKLQRFEKLILENYIFCYHQKFNEKKSICEARFIKGLEYFLNGYYQNQNEIIEFIRYCKCSENSNGYLTQAFFKTIITKKAKFISGPFTNMMFEIVNKQKNKLKIIVGNVVTTISDNSNYLYRPV